MACKIKLFLFAAILSVGIFRANGQRAVNPVIFSDVPDMSIIRNGDTYYMSSTTMHMSPGVPIMKSKDLINWAIVRYAYDTLANIDDLTLTNGKNAYGRGSWASSMRYHNGTYYVTTFAQTTGKSYIFSTNDIEKGKWKVTSFKPSYHDHSLVFDDDGKVYLIYGNGKLSIIELDENVSGIKAGGINQVLIENASAPAGPKIGLGAEGSQLFKVNDTYYLFNITWPKDGMRTVVVHRAKNILGPWEGKVVLQDRGIAQGGITNTPKGEWYAYLFRDFGAVGRIPYLSPVQWKDGWPVIGNDGKVPDSLSLPLQKGLAPGIVASDEFTRKKGDPKMPLIWQWNHNPENSLWSLTQRKGFLRLTTGRVDTSVLSARNTLTQRTFGPVCSVETALDFTGLKDGDCAGLMLLQKNYGFIGVKAENNQYHLVMVNGQTGTATEAARVPIKPGIIYLKTECDFTDKKDIAHFFYSTDGKQWAAIGTTLKMSYTLPHFMGYRFGLFNYSTKAAGGHADFDYFRIGDTSSGIN